jgi:hypothetical protein
VRPPLNRLSLAAALIAGGILVEVVTLYWGHPLAFLVFMFVASPLKLAGILVYLSSLLLPPRGVSY